MRMIIDGYIIVVDVVRSVQRSERIQNLIRIMRNATVAPEETDDESDPLAESIESLDLVAFKTARSHCNDGDDDLPISLDTDECCAVSKSSSVTEDKGELFSEDEGGGDDLDGN
ncbi:hypothetical protein QR98_0094770 [Sarcoptes scabiei]|uniref:Uncharacterized protein n=1 Tax=Sarcoptes scabiei TaxID=52283 RepID=A0A132AIU9_SARSC|nr:hypothetical protein QR98_0094770 [Sarcoptes scabiei]